MSSKSTLGASFAILTVFFLTRFPIQAHYKPYLHLVESTPVSTNGVEFVALVEEQCVYPDRTYRDVTVDVRLRITNKTEKKLVFLTFDTLGIRLKDANGKDVPDWGGRDVTCFPRPIMILPGGNHSMCLKCEIRDFPNGSRRIAIEDGTGRVFDFGPIAEGNYTLTFSYNSQDPTGFLTQPESLDGIAVWKGKLSTKEVKFQVGDVDNVQTKP